MTMTIRNAISASSAFCETWEPQLDPTVSIEMLPTLMSNFWAMARSMSSDLLVDSWVVCTCQYGALPLNGLTSVAVGLVPPLALATCSRPDWVTDAVAGTVNTDPPLKSTLKSRPRKISASRLMTRMNPEIVYQSFCRLTKSKETSPR